MSFAVKVIDHVEVFVGDLEVAAKWYGDVRRADSSLAAALSARVESRANTF